MFMKFGKQPQLQKRAKDAQHHKKATQFRETLPRRGLAPTAGPPKSMQSSKKLASQAAAAPGLSPPKLHHPVPGPPSVPLALQHLGTVDTERPNGEDVPAAEVTGSGKGC